MSRTRRFWTGDQWINVELEITKTRIVFHYPFCRELNDILKTSVNARFDWKMKKWYCEPSARASFTFDFLENGPVSGRYYSEISTTALPRRKEMRAHQIELFHHVLTRRCAMAAYEMGTGKTLTGIEIMEWIRDNSLDGLFDGLPDEYRMWVVCPLRVKSVWTQEIKKWRSDISPRLITNSYQGIQKAMEGQEIAPQVLFVDESSHFRRRSKRTLLLLELSNRMHGMWGGDTYIVTMTGTPSPKSHEDWFYQVEIAQPGFITEADTYKFGDRLAVYEKQENAFGGSYRKRTAWRDKTCLECGESEGHHTKPAPGPAFTMTPMTKEEKETHLNFCTYTPKVVCQNCRKAHSKKRYSDCKEYKPDRLEKNELAALGPRLAPLVIVKRKADCLELPEKQYISRVCEIPRDMVESAEIVASQCENRLQLITALRQFSDGFLYIKECDLEDEDDADPWAGFELDHGKETPSAETKVEVVQMDEKGIRSKKRITQTFEVNPKYEMLQTILEEIGAARKSRVVIFAAYHASIDLCIKACLEQGWDVMRLDGRGWIFLTHDGRISPDLESGQTWDGYFRESSQDEDRPLAFVGHPQAAGMGLNLQVSEFVVFYSNIFKAEYRSQAEDRCHRMGMVGDLTIYDLICLGTDRLLAENLIAKKDAEQLTLAQIQSALKGN